MKCRIVFFEGIPGIGKTFFANKVEAMINRKGLKCKHYTDDGSLTPLNLKGCAALKRSEYKRLLKTNSDKKELIEGSFVGKYGKFYFIDQALKIDSEKDFLESHSFYGGHFKERVFTDCLASRFKEFYFKNKTTDEVFVFEGAIFRDIVDELYRFSNYDNNRIGTEVSLLCDILTPLKPTVFLLQTNFSERHLEGVRNLRKNGEEEPWVTNELEFVKKSQYGRICNVKDFDDLELYFLRRSSLDEICYINLEWNKYLVNIDDYQLLQRKMERFIEIIE